VTRFNISSWHGRAPKIALIVACAVGAATLTTTAAHADPPPAPWAGTVTLTTSQSTTDVNDPWASLTATASPQLSDGLQMAIYDDTGHRVSPGGCYSTGCSAQVMPGTNAGRTYTAYVSANPPDSGLPTSDVRATSTSVTVTNLGWTGTIALATSTTTTDAGAPFASLTATPSTSMGGGYVMAIYDDTGHRVSGGYGCYYGTCTASVMPATNATRTYTAYVSLDFPDTGLPTHDVRATSSVTVANQGWTGAVTLTTSSATTDAGDPFAYLTATPSTSMGGGYVMAIYDDTGHRVSGGYGCYYGTCSATVMPANNTTRTYTAYVSLDFPDTGLPTHDVRATSSVTVTNVGWTGAVDLTTSSPTTDTSDPFAYLTATVSKPLAGGYVMAIYDDTGHRVSGGYGCYYSTCTASVMPATNTTRTYTAYVSLDFPDTGLPTQNVRATSSLTVQNQGWTGTVALTTDSPSTDVNAPFAYLTATASKPLAGGYVMAIYDDTGHRVSGGYGCYSTTCTATAVPAMNATRTYTAYVSLDFPATGLPVQDARSVSSVTVQNLGWTGTVALSTDRSETDSANPTAGVTATASTNLAGGYVMGVYDETGQRIPWDCVSTTCTVNVAPAVNAQHIYTAVVSLGYLDTGPPAPKAQVSSNDVIVTNVSSDTASELAALAAAAALMQDACVEMFPVAPESTGTSLNQAQALCEADRASGMPWTTVIQALIDAFGPAIVIAAAIAIHDGGTKVGAPPRPGPTPTPPPTAEPNPLPPPFDSTFLDGGAHRLLQRDHVTGFGYLTDPHPETTARKVYAQCVRLATFASSGINRGACDTMPIFAPGYDVDEATQHDFDVIWKTPSTVSLTAMTGEEKGSTGAIEGWYDRTAYAAICPGRPRPTGADGEPTQCDEYPYYSSEEGGPQPNGSLLPDQLRLINAAQNAREGYLLKGFYSYCGSTAAPQGSPARKYLVIPMPAQDSLPTTGYCRPGKR
jgi:hypothetical protein